MNTNQKRCLAVSGGFHLSLLFLLVLTPALATRRPPPDGPEIIMLPSSFALTDGPTQGAGPEQTAPPIPKPAPPASAAPISREHVPESKPPEKITKTKPAPEPSEPEAPIEKSKQSRVARIFNELMHHTSTKPLETLDGDKVIKHHETEKNKSDATTTDKPTKTVKIASDVKKHRPEDDTEARKMAAEEASRAREVAEVERKAQAARAARANALANLQNALSGAEGAIKKNLNGSAEITMPGPGRQAFVSYFDYLRAFYKTNWRKPAAISQAEASVGTEITVLKDGTLKDYKILEPSGIKDLDDSVKDVLRKYRALRPLPAESTDSERTFTIRFTLTADSST